MSSLREKSAERLEVLKAKGVPAFEELPEGWKLLTAAAPQGYLWVFNGKSRFGGEFRHALVKSNEHCI